MKSILSILLAALFAMTLLSPVYAAQQPQATGYTSIVNGDGHAIACTACHDPKGTTHGLHHTTGNTNPVVMPAVLNYAPVYTRRPGLLASAPLYHQLA